MKNISESSHINKDRGIQTEKEKALTLALERGMGYLESKSQGSLYKEDFGLRHGDSIAWSTAYVARLLKEIEPEKIKGNESALLNLQNSDGGWGYNNLVPSDADSTANALLLLKDTLNKEKYDEAVKFIKSHQHANGGISTYTLDNLQKMGYKGEGWAMPHVCVTALVAGVLEEEEKGKALRFLTSQRQPNGSFLAYWWASNLYATNEAMKVLGSDPQLIEYFESVQCTNVFDLSIKIQARASLGLDTETLVDELLKAQEQDGGWPSSPILKIPRSEVKPGEIVVGVEIATDRNRLFSTINALLALKNYHDRGLFNSCPTTNKFQ